MLGPSAIYLTVEDLSGSGDAPGKRALAAAVPEPGTSKVEIKDMAPLVMRISFALNERISMQNGRGLCFLHAEIFGNVER